MEGTSSPQQLHHAQVVEVAADGPAFDDVPRSEAPAAGARPVGRAPVALEEPAVDAGAPRQVDHAAAAEGRSR